jgi:hypothetical protein
MEEEQWKPITKGILYVSLSCAFRKVAVGPLGHGNQKRTVGVAIESRLPSVYAVIDVMEALKRSMERVPTRKKPTTATAKKRKNVS